MSFITEVLPVIIFFVAYKFYGMVEATIAIIVASVIGAIYNYYKTKTISKQTVITTSILAVFGGITILSGDSSYIKMKPTIINLVFATVLFAGVFKKKGFVRYLLGSEIDMSDKAWEVLSLRFAYYFLFLAGLNEYIWRNFSENFWVNFKLFGMIPISFVFIFSQIPFIYKNQQKESTK